MVGRVKLPIRSFAQKVAEFSVNKLQSFRNWASKNWAKYILYRGVFFILYLPFWILLLYASSGSGFVSLFIVVVGIIALGVSLFVDALRPIIAEGDPEAFILAEKYERNFNRYGNIMSFLTIGYAYSLLPIVLLMRSNPATNSATLPIEIFYPFVALVFVMFSGLIPMMINSIELTVMVQTKRAHPNWHISEYFPHESIRASARFTVVSKLLPCNPRKYLLSEFSLFKEGVEIYNEYIKNRYKMVLNDPDRFYKQIKLKAFFSDESEKIKPGIDSLIMLMHTSNEQEQPFAFVKTLKQMINEPISNDEICKEFEIDTRLIKRWLTKHHSFLKDFLIPLCIALVPIIISIIIGLRI